MTRVSEMHRLSGKEPHIISLTLLSGFAAMGAILMTPALPDIANFFHLSLGVTQLTVTSFLLGYSLGQLIYGPISNRMGRKSAFYLGIIIATVGSLLSIISSPIESFHFLIWGRFLEALGASAGLVVSFTLINDFYYPKKARKITAMMMVSFAIVPGVAITIGGFLTQYFRWQSCFYFLLFYGLILTYAVYIMPETLTEKDPKAFHYRHLFKNYLKIFKNKKIIALALCAGFSSGCVYLFGAEGPLIGIHKLGVSPAKYGLLGLTPFIGTFIGALLNIRLSSINSLLIIKLSILTELIAASSMFIFFWFDIVNLYSLLIPMALLCSGHPFLSGTALSLAMNQTNDRANCSAVMSFIAMSIPVIFTFFLGVFHSSNPLILPTLLLISLILLLLNYLFLLREK